MGDPVRMMIGRVREAGGEGSSDPVRWRSARSALFDVARDALSGSGDVLAHDTLSGCEIAVTDGLGELPVFIIPTLSHDGRMLAGFAQ